MSWRRWGTRPQLLGLTLAAWSCVVRWLAAGASTGHVFYFPDSWNYVALPSQGRSHPFHGDFIYSLWDLFIPGTPTEAAVVRLHQLVGIATVLAVWLLLRRLVVEPIAFGTALIFGAQPLALFFERTILTETLALGLVTVVLFALLRLADGHSWIAGVAAVALGGSAGVLLALRPSSRLAAIAPVAIGAVLVARRLWKAESVRSRVVAGCILVALAGSILPAPLIVRARHADAFGTSSLTPAAGTAVLAWWGWRLDCPTDETLTPQARAALEATCEQLRPERQLMWVDPVVNASMQPHDEFAETQTQLSDAARRAMTGSPRYLIRRFVSQTAEHAVDPVVNLERFSTGQFWASRSTQEPFPGIDEWFGDRTPVSWPAEPGIFRLVRQSARLPGVLSLIALALSAGVAWRWMRQARRVERWRAILEPSPRAVMLVASMGMIVGNEVVVALGGVAIFRYWVPLLPAVAVAVAISLDYALGRSAPQSTG